MYMSSGMVILVGMSSMKSFYKKNRGKQEEMGSHRVLSLCLFLSGGLDVPNIYIGPECAEFSKRLDTKSSL